MQPEDLSCCFGHIDSRETVLSALCSEREARWTPNRAIRVRAAAGALRCVLIKTLDSHSASLHPGV